jgi:GNAT superfamily N-acetyltransferase
VTPPEGTVIKRPSECTVAEREVFAALVLAGGQVFAAGLPDRIAGADRLAFHYRSGAVVGVGGLKNLPLSYRDGIFRQAGSSLRAADFPLELGWVFVEPAHRGTGISGHLVQALMEGAGDRNVYAISHSDNHPIHKSLERHGFVREGTPYPSTIQPGAMVQLFVGRKSRSV